MFKSASIPFLRALRPSNPRLNGPFLKGFPLSKNIYFRTTTSFSVSTPKVPSLASLRKIGSPAISNYSEHISAGLKYMNESETKAAYRQFQKAFKLSVDLFGDKSKNAAICLNYLAQASQLEGNLKNSLKFYNEALDIASEGQEANNLLVSDIHHDINLVYQTQGNLVKAKKHVEMSLRILQEYFPEEYKRQSLVLQSLGSIYISSNDLKQAEACLFGSLDILKENQDCESTEFRLLCDKIAALFEKQGNNIEAIKYRKMALSIIDSAQLTQTGLFNQYLNLAALYNKVSKDEESLICLEKAYEQLQYDHQKQNHAHKAPLLIKIGQLCLKLGKVAQAIQRLQEALECLSENGMQSQIMVDKVKKILSQAYSLKNKSSPRIDKLRESLDVMMESSVSYDLNDAEGYKELGLSYLQGLDRENGRKALIRALQIFNGVKGPECAESKELKKILKNAGFF